MMIPDFRPARAADETDFSDLTDSEQTGPARWHPDTPDALVIPFDHEPTAAEAAAIRRRLITADAAEEAQLYRLLDAHKDPAAPEWAKIILAVELAKYGEPV